MRFARLAAGIVFALAALAPLNRAVTQPRSGAVQADARAEVAAALYAASATQAASERAADARLSQARAEIETLRARGAGARAELISAQERYVADLAARDRAYAQEIAVFRGAVENIAATPEGVALLAQRRPGHLAAVRRLLIGLAQARNAAIEQRANIERAANTRAVAAIALDDSTKDEATTEEVIALYQEVTRLDPGVHWDWVELGRLYVDAGNLPAARSAAERAAQTAGDDRDRSVALEALGNVLVAQGDLNAARARYEESLRIGQSLAAADPSSASLRRDATISQSKLGGVLFAQGDYAGAQSHYDQSLTTLRRLERGGDSSAFLRRLVLANLGSQGDIAYARGNFAGALSLWEEALSLA